MLDPENEAGELAHRLFEFAEGDVSVRTLLLSATPYKMYTLHGEVEDDHYRDFMQTLRFLFNDDDEAGQVEALFKRMRRSLYRIPSAGPEEALECRSGVEQHLRKVMVRTERARASDSGDDMLMEVPDSQPALSRTDAGRYLALQRMVRSVNGPDMIEYWKSAPYLLNFMDEYKVKHLVRDALKVGGNESLARELRRHQSLLLSEEAVTAYRAIDPGNARLRMLLEDVIRQGVWNMLWLPPSLPPYGLQGNYARVDPRPGDQATDLLGMDRRAEDDCCTCQLRDRTPPAHPLRRAGGEHAAGSRVDVTVVAAGRSRWPPHRVASVYLALSLQCSRPCGSRGPAERVPGCGWRNARPEIRAAACP
ncbi:MAG: hypothetical protein U5L08_07515 [Xanthomonadales bacterium]|nr:hypothetical protein [Xanthomonadales bacterium]